MDMIDKYLNAVAAQLPQAERADIIAELRDLILHKFEAKEAELGRPLNDEDKENILREIGHPLVVAARYRKGPDSLVGPQLFPYWLFAVKAGLLIVAAFCVLGMVLEFLSRPTHLSQAIAHALSGFVNNGLMLMGIATLTAAAFEHFNIRPRFLTHWRVSDLGAFGLSDPTNWRSFMGQASPAWSKGWQTAREKTAQAWDGASRAPRTPTPPFAPMHPRWPGMSYLPALIVSTVFLLWWIGAVQIPGNHEIHLRGENAVVTGAPIWTQLYGVILVYALANVALELSGVLWPYAVRARAAGQMGLACFGLFLTWTIFNAGHWFTLTRAGESARVEGGLFLLDGDAWRHMENWHDLTGMASNLSVIWTWALVFIGASLVFKIFGAMWRLGAPVD